MTTTLTRTALFDATRAVDGRVPVVVSTTEPVDRNGIAEILSHDPGDIDLSRAPLPLLVAHNSEQLPIGVVEELRTDGTKLRGLARFSDNPTAQAIAADVKAGILRSVSVGYSITRFIRRSAEEMLCAWMPFEVSCVSVPADRGAGFYRTERRNTMQDQIHDGSNAEQSQSRSQRRAASREEIADLERRDAIRSIGDQYARYLRPNDAADACRRGDSVAQFQEFIIARMETGHTDTSLPCNSETREWNGLTSNYSLTRAVGNILNPGNSTGGREREVSEELARKFGRQAAPGGFWTPDAALYGKRGVSIGTAATGGGALHTGAFHGELFADAFRAQTVIGALGARILTGATSDIIIPRKTAVSSVSWVSEIGTASEGTPDFDQLTLQPKRLSSYVVVSQQALIQSGLALENLLRDDLVVGAMVELDRVALRGAGTSSEPTGLMSATGLGTVTGGSNGATITYGHLVDLEAACAIVNAAVGRSGFAVPPKVRQKLKQSPKIGTSVTELAWNDLALSADGIGMVAGHRAGVTTNLRSNLTKGTSTTVCSELLFGSDWSELIVARFGGSELIFDPYSLSVTVQVMITLNNFADVGVRRAAAFSKMVDALTT